MLIHRPQVSEEEYFLKIGQPAFIIKKCGIDIIINKQIKEID